MRSQVLAAVFAFVSQLAFAQEKQLSIGMTQEFESLNPVIMTMSASSYTYYMVGRPLTYIDNDWKWQCLLCTEIPTLENGRAKAIEEGGVKKLVVSWQLKPGLKWGDGTPLTAKDLKLAWEVGKSPNVSVASKETFERIEAFDLDAKDPLAFVTKLKEARYDYYQLSLPALPEHLEGSVWAATKDQNGAYEKQTKYSTEPTNPGLYNGPFTISELKLGSHIVVKKNENFWGQKPLLDKVILKLIANTQTLEAALLSGDIDMISELGMSFDQALAFEKKVAKDKALEAKFDVKFRDGLIYEHIDLNLRNPILADKNVRKALLYAIDRDKLTQALFEGRQKKALHNLHPLDPYFSDNVTKYEYDGAKAAELLEASGWKKGADGIRAKDGKKLELVIMTTAGNKTRELVQVFLQQEYKKVGIELTIKNEPARVFFGETVRKAAYPALAMYAWTSSPDNPPRSTMHSAEIPTEANSYSGQNSGGFASAESDKLLEDVMLEFDFAKRKQMMERIQQIYTEEVPVLPLYLRAEIAVTPKKLSGFKLAGHLFYSTLGVENWTLDGKIAQGH